MLLLFSAFPFVALGFVYNGLNYTITGSGGCAVARNSSATGNISIPNTVFNVWNDSQGNQHEDSYVVTSISENAFNGCSGLTSVIIPNSVTSIDKGAFYRCSDLDSVSIGNSVTSVGEWAFFECVSLTSVTIPNSVTSIKGAAFYDCHGLNVLTIGSNVEEIGSQVFFGCDSLKTVNWNVKNYIQTYYISSPFSNLNSITTFNFGNEVKVIPHHLCKGLTGLTHVTLSESVKTIQEDAFNGCNGLTEINFPESINSIGKSAFSGCIGLTRASLVVDYINENAFANCTGLTEVDFNGKRIYSQAFLNCVNLNTISIGTDVDFIYSDAFSGCDGLKTVNWNVRRYNYLGWGKCFDGNEEGTVVEPREDNPPFYGLTNIETFNFGNEVEYISGYLCNDLTGLTSINVPNSVTSIRNYAFTGCSGLTRASLGNSVATIEYAAFAGCTCLSSIIIPNSVTHIGASAFSNCSNLPSITIPNKVKTIEEGAFSSCTSLISIVVDSGNSFYDSRDSCNAIIETASNTLIAGCKNTVIPKTVTSIGSSAFSDCSGLTSVTIPNSVTYIGEYAFSGCSGLTSVAIPNSVTYIGASAFSNCSSLKDIYCKIKDPSKVTLGYASGYWDFVFYNVPTSTCILHVPGGTKKLFEKANQWKDFIIVEDDGIIKRFANGFLPIPDWDSFYDPDKQPVGITADGLSQMRLIVNEPINAVKSYTITTLIDGVETSDERFTGHFSNLELMQYEDGTKLSMIYTAPEDFIYNTTGDSYTIEVRLDITDDKDEEYCDSIDFEVLRPGVILLHGLLSNEDCFNGLKSYLENQGYRNALVLNGDYRGSNAQSFVNNTYVNNVVGDHMKKLFKQLSQQGIISARYDLVGHSMGGILSRMYAQEIKPDAVNRIITLDTPHSGSQLANLRNPVLNGLSVSTVGHPLLQAALAVLRTQLQGNGIFAAIENLEPSSESIARLNGSSMGNAVGIPVHAICSVIQAPQQSALDAQETCHTSPVSSVGISAIHDFLFKPNKESGNQTRWDTYYQFFNGDNDGVVSYASQAGGLSGNYVTLETDVYRGKLGFDSWAHHCKTNKWFKTYGNIALLLTSPKSSNVFSTSGFHPVQLAPPVMEKMPAQLTSFKSAGSGTSIALQVDHQEADTTVLQIHVTRSSDIIRHIVYTFTGEDEMIFSLDEQDCEFQISENYHGKLNIFVLGRTANGELVADEVVVDNGFIDGDVNVDGSVNVSDVTTLINMILGIIPTEKSMADVNDDGRVNVSDVTALINIILGK